MARKAKHTRIKVLFILAAIFLTALSITAYIRINTLIASGDLVNQTQLIKLELEEIRSGMVSADTHQKNYLLTGDSSILKSRDEVIRRVAVVVAVVDSLVRGNPKQVENLETLKAAINLKLSAMKKVIQLYTPQGKSPEF